MPLRTCAALQRRILASTALFLMGLSSHAAAPNMGLPTPVLQALERAKVPPQAMAVVVEDPSGTQARLRWNSQQPMNPASVVKLVTTLAALESLGPSWVWQTPVWLDGPIDNPGPEGVLQGSVHLKGSGDPKLTLERIWALLQRVRALGVREIRGDIVLDQSAFWVPAADPGDFDGESLRPYNVQARALMLNQRTVTYHFVPDPARGTARVWAEPALQGVQVDAAVPLVAGSCNDWRSQLKGQFQDPGRVRWLGRYPAACGTKQWPLAYADPASYDSRLLQALWLGMGGQLSGTVREGPSPARAPTFEWASPPLSDVVRDINKFSNNTMAQMLALTWTAQQMGSSVAGPGVPDAQQVRTALQQWAQGRLGGAGLRLENGSGLSREQRLSADQVATLLRQAWASPVLPELIASLAVAGAPDGTLGRLQTSAGRAYLKTGSLRDVVAAAGYVLGRSGQRWVVVVLIHHDQAQAARPALEALVQWAIQDQTPARLRSNPRRGWPE
ncbi:MAG: D-alanyl-D-alanine carboxypeptidase/D-alanyl-D-alanine-endopeptidase [Betaproteobacteria bacterium]|nr:D-alanyl-D-alanine carboxypeptidase/D-alanyl-D-alanine-endopeptidase [Betaproteobacteria bacterium]